MVSKKVLVSFCRRLLQSALLQWRGPLRGFFCQSAQGQRIHGYRHGANFRKCLLVEAKAACFYILVYVFIRNQKGFVWWNAWGDIHRIPHWGAANNRPQTTSVYRDCVEFVLSKYDVRCFECKLVVFEFSQSKKTCFGANNVNSNFEHYFWVMKMLYVCSRLRRVSREVTIYEKVFIARFGLSKNNKKNFEDLLSFVWGCFEIKP